MSNFSQFFSSGGGLYATPPKRIKPANFGGGAGFLTYVDNWAFPCRAAAGTYFSLNNGSPITLKNATNGTTIATINASNIKAGTTPNFTGILCYDDIGGLLYVAAYNSANAVQLASINDTTGAITLIGAAFTPTTISNWTEGSTYTFTSNFFTYLSSGNLHVLAATSGTSVYEHVLSTSTGLVSQNGTHVLSDGTSLNLYGVNYAPYITANNSEACLITGSIINSGMTISLAKSGIVLNSVAAPNDFVMPTVSVIIRTSIYLGLLNQSNTSAPFIGWRFYDPVDWDRYVNDLIYAIAGV